MPNAFTQYGTKVIFRERPTRQGQSPEVKETTFKGVGHAEKAAAFVVFNKKEWDFHTLQTVSQVR